MLDPFHESARITAALYKQPLAELNLTPGKLAPENDQQKAYRLPPTEELFEAQATEENLAWQPVQEASANPTFTTFRRTGPPLCDTFRAVPTTPPIKASVHSLATLRDGKILAVTETNRFYVIDESGAATELEDVPIVKPFQPVSVAQLPSGEIWIGGRAGAVRRGNLIDGFVAVDSPTRSDLLGLDGSRGDPSNVEDEIFALSKTGAFLRYYQGSWELLRDESTGDPSSDVSVAWIRSGRALATGNSLGAVLHFDASTPSRVHEQRIEIVYGEGTTLQYIETFGTIFTTSLHRIFLIDTIQVGTAPLVELGFTTTRDSVSAIAPYKDYFVLVGDAGSVVQYHPEVSCPFADMAQPEVGISAAKRIGSSTTLVISGHQRESLDDNTVFLVTPEPRSE